MSSAEVILWSRLKLLRARGFHIRRQAPFRGYFLDFVCYARRLVIEVDGSQHAEDVHEERDMIRDRILSRHGFKVVRFTAGEVRRQLGSVMDRIVSELEAAPYAGRRPDFPSPSGEGQAAQRPGWGSLEADKGPAG